MGKSEEEELEEIIRLLRKLLSRKLKSRGPRRVYAKPKEFYKPAGSYRITRNYPTHLLKYRASSGPEPKYAPKKERSISYVVKPWSGPMQYRPKERLIYDPEVKMLLQKIERHLSSEPDAEEILRQLENSPELYHKVSERLLERINEDSHEQTEASEAYEPAKEELELSTKTEPDIVAELEQNDVKVEEITPEKLEEGSSELELPTEQIQENELSTIEHLNVLAPEPNDDVIEQIEAQDLSSLEDELYQEPLEPEASSEVNTEPLEPLRSNIEADLRLETEMMDDPVFWQNVENEIIEKRFKKAELRAEPEVDEYGY